MEKCTFLLLLVLATVLSSIDSRGYCNIRAQPNLIPEGLSGTWYLVKWKIPPGLPSTTGSYHYTWYMKVDPLTRRFDIIQTGRPRTPPYQCFENPATLTPIALPYSKQDVYVWRTGGPILNDAEAVITDTDYSTYLVVYFCVPSFRPGCEIKVDVYTRFKRPNRHLVKFLDRLTARRLCLNPRTFFFTLLESYGVPRCPRPETSTTFEGVNSFLQCACPRQSLWTASCVNNLEKNISEEITCDKFKCDHKNNRYMYTNLLLYS